MKKFLRLTLFFLILCSASFGQNALQNEINSFATKTGAIPTIDKATNSISFLRFPANKPLKINGITSNDKALGFMVQNAGIFGVKSGRDSFSIIKQQRDTYGLEHEVLQHYINNVPVYDGLLKFHYNKNKDLTSLNGNFIQVDRLNTIPTVSKGEAEALALKMVESQKMKEFNSFAPIPLKANKNTLYVFQKGLAQGYNGPKHLVYEVEVRNDKDIREFVFIDAHTKELVEQFTGMHATLNRKLYQPTYNAAAPATNLLWQEGDTFPGTLDQWQRSEIESAGQMYNLMKNAFGRISYNGADAAMITTNNNPSISCPNANWNGISANYCNGTASDDVVAHEWGHAYTEYTSGLIYAWQSGAMNEAYSDIWGETVDQLNNYFDSGEGTAIRAFTGDDCPADTVSTRWKVGEKATAFGGSLRDMYNPNCNNDPGRVLDPKYYCSSALPSNSNDQGGVHHNSGIINHSYALLVDGGTYNGQTITGIGLTKAAHIYWYAQENFMTKTTDFAAQADILEASAQALLDANINLPNLSTDDVATSLSGLYITAADIFALHKVLLAVELRADNNCVVTPFYQPVAAICHGGDPGNAIFLADFETGLGDWTVANLGVNGTWRPRDWVATASAPEGRAGKVAFGINSLGGDCETDLQNGVISLSSPAITIPVDASGPFNLAFDHLVSLRPGWDGGIVSYKIGAGSWTQVPLASFIANGYNATIYTVAQGNIHPLAGKKAFSGGDVATVSSGWIQSRINLSTLGLDPGETIQFRWDLGTVGCGEWAGWYLDNVTVYTCAVPSVQFVNAGTIVNEAEATNVGPSPNACLPYVEKIITVKINKAPSAPVTITFTAPTGTATMGETTDYTFSPLTFDLQAGHLSQDVTFRIYNDAYVEGNETVVLNYTMSGGDGFPETFNQTHTITINDNDVIPGLDSKTPLYADFNDGLIPSGWTYGGTAGTYPQEWGVYTGNDKLDLTGAPFLWANSDARGTGLHTYQIETAPFNTLNMTNLNISFLQYFRVYNGGYNESAKVEVWDGTDWQVILTQTHATGTIGAFNGGAVTTNIPIPVAYANAAMKLRFSYTANYDYWWALDNIKVTGLYPKQIESAVTALPDQQYLGPMGKAYFYDPITKDLLAAVENLTSHDYGCTSVSVDRAGNGSATWVGPYTITNKTYLITPSYPNPTGKYKITIYYKDTELGAFKSSIQSMGKSVGGITTGNLATSSFAEVEIHQAFNTDWEYTAEFDSGFSGFGLSDAPPIGALPVTLVKFEGKNIENGNVLEWSTSSEVNNDHFIIERAIDAKHFNEVTRVSGVGTSSITSNYSFVDTKFSTGLNYYRLKQVDRNGRFAFSKIVAIESNILRELKYFPNPVQTLLSIDLPEVTSEPFNMEIVNGAGQVVMKLGKVRTSQGLLTQDVSKLIPGVYQVLISNSLASYNFKIVKL